MSNDDENKHPVSGKNHKGKKSSHLTTTAQPQYRILHRDKPDDAAIQLKTIESNNHDINIPEKSQRNRRKFPLLYSAKKK